MELNHVIKFKKEGIEQDFRITEPSIHM